MKAVVMHAILLLFYIPAIASIKINVKNYGAKGDGKTDDTKSIQSAIGAANPLKETTIYFPKGIYYIASYTTTSNYLENYSLLLHSNLDIVGDGDETIIRIANHLFDKTDTSANAHLFYGKKIANISFSRLIIDMNGSNNLVPNKVIKNHAAIFTSYGSNYHIHDLIIKNCSGTNMLNIMSKGSGLIVENCKFINGGNYVGSPLPNNGQYDYSFIYSEWDSTIVQNNIIQQQDINISLQNYTGGIELHGSNSSATDNTIVGCWPAIYVTSGGKSPLKDVVIKSNRIINCVTGISFWTIQPMNNITISNNYIQLTQSRSDNLKLCSGIYVPNGNSKIYNREHANAAPITNLQITSNIITAYSMETLSAGMVLHSLQYSTVQNNTISGMNYAGIVLQGSKWGINSLLVNNNTFNDFTFNNDKNAVSGYVVATDTYSGSVSNAPGFEKILFTNNKFLRNRTNAAEKNKSNTKFRGAFIALPGKMTENITFKNNEFSEQSEKVHIVKTN